MKVLQWISLVFSLVLGSFSASFAATYHVEMSGNDTTGDGSSAKPWKTLTFACAHVQTDRGHIVHVGSGEFYEPGNIVVATGISIEGEGAARTTIKSDNVTAYKGLLFLYAPPLSTQDPVLYTSVGNQFIRKLRISGMNRKEYTGIAVSHRKMVTIDSVQIDSCSHSAIELQWQVADITISNSLIRESSEESTGASSGNIDLAGTCRRVLIDKCRIEHWGKTGYGIKGTNSYQNADTLFSCRFTNLTILGKSMAPWDNYHAPNMSIELASGVAISECEIARCTVNNQLSVPVFDRTAGPYSIRIHHNTLRTQRGAAIELATDNMIIDSNYFALDSAGVGFSEYGRNLLVRNVVIRNSVFYPYWDLGGFTSKIKGFWFINNTCVTSASCPYVTKGISSSNGALSDSVFIMNNIFYNQHPKGGSLIYIHDSLPVHKLTNWFCSNNCVFNTTIDTLLKPTKLITLAPGLSMKGNMPSPYFVPASARSPVVDAGVNVGYPFIGTAPDIGAYEFGLSTGVKPPGMPLMSPECKGGELALPPAAFDLAGRRESVQSVQSRHKVPGISVVVAKGRLPSKMLYTQ